MFCYYVIKPAGQPFKTGQKAMKTKVTYAEVKAALKAGFVSPLNSKTLKPAIALAKHISSFIDAVKPRVAANYVTDVINDSGLIGKVKAPQSKKKLNEFIEDCIIDLNKVAGLNN